MKILGVSFILIFSIKIYGQNLTSRWQRKSLVIEKKIFLAKNDTLINKLLLQKAMILKNAGHQVRAIQTFERIPYQHCRPEIGFEAAFNLAMLNYSINEFDAVSQYLSDMDFYFDKTDTSNRVLFLKVLTYNVQEKYNQARKALKKYSSQSDCSVNIDSLYRFEQQLKDPAKARRLSGFLPGLGQFYAGKPWQGINSLMLNSLSLGYATYCGLNKMYASSVFTGLNLFMAFYSGGKRNAYSIVNNQKANEIKKLNSFLIIWSNNCSVSENK